MCQKVGKLDTGVDSDTVEVKRGKVKDQRNGGSLTGLLSLSIVDDEASVIS